MKKILAVSLLLAGIAAAQTYGSFSGVVTGPTGIPVASASVTICHAGSVIIGTDCAQKATIYSSSTGGVLANPLTTNANGEFTFYAPPGDYTYSWSGNLYRASVTMAGNPVIAGLTIGSGPVMTAAPVMTFGFFSPYGSSVNTAVLYKVTMPSPITVKRIIVTGLTNIPNCSVAPVWTVSDGTHSATLTQTNAATSDSGPLSVAMNAATITVSDGGGTCTTDNTNYNLTVEYQMQ